MATKKEKKLEHIQVKDNGIKLSQDIGDKLADIKTLLENEIIDGLLKHSNETNLNRYRIAQNVNLRNYQYLSDKVISKVKKDVKTSLKDDNTVNLTNKQVVNMSSQINKGLLFLQNSAVKTYQDTLTNILLRCKSAGDLKEQLQKHIDSGIDVGVVYQNGREYQFDTYWEMKARTDIQNDIGSNMVKTGQENGVIFYIAAYFGDCAKDHVEYQGKIYVDKNWESNAPKDRLEEIRSYINSHDVKTVQEVMEAPAYFTTRPNCRHYFQYIDIDSVLGAKTKEDVSKLRDERNLNFNGKYKPEKYQALQQQRANERKIRAEKKAIDKLEHELALKPGDKNIQSQIKIGEANVRRYQAEQRKLVKEYSNIIRNYKREQVGLRADLGANAIPIQNDGGVRVQSQNESVNEQENENNKKPMIEHSPDFAVDFNVIESRKYNDKVLNMVGGSIEDKRNVYPAIKDILKHRSGTNGEDLVVYNPKTKEIYMADKSNTPSAVEPDKTALDLIKKDPQNTITIHNHPESLPPSIHDLNALVERNQSIGFVVTHDGRIYRYTKPKTKIGGSPLANTVDKVRLMKYDNEEKERLEILNILKDLYKFEFEEVLD